MREHWVTMGALQLLVAALAAMMAIGTMEATAVGFNEPLPKIPTHCPAVDAEDHVVLLAHEIMCNLFYMCHAGEKIVKVCAAENEQGDVLNFDAETQSCQWRRLSKCRNPRCSLSTDRNGRPIKLPFGGLCKNYYDCAGDRLVVKACPTGENFDYNLRVCRKASEANCKPIQHCTSDRKERVEESCSFYSICLATRKVILPCPADKFFSQSRQACVDQRDSDCGNIPCSGTGKVPHPTDCTKYTQCVRGFVVTKSCGEGLHFNPFTHTCQNPKDAGCDTRRPCFSVFPFHLGPVKCNGNGLAPNKCNCHEFKECVNGIVVDRSCAKGLHFNPHAQKCMHPCEAHCDLDWPCHTPTPTPTPTPPPECTGNGKMPDPHDCNKYKQCVNGKIVTKKCPAGLHYNPYKQECTHPCDAGCDKDWPCHTPTPTPTPTPPPECTGNGRRPDEHDCSKYKQCVNGKIVTKNCRPGLHYNPYKQECMHPCDAGCDKDWPCHTPTPTPTPTPPPECTGNGKKPDEHDCSKYKQCVNGKIVTKKCPVGLHYNPYKQECTHPCDAGCDKDWPCHTPTPTPTPTPPPECTGNGKMPDAHDCSKYKQCVNGKIVTKKCPVGLHYNPYKQECTHPCDAGCDKDWPCHTPTPTPTPTPPPECTGNGKRPDEHDCSKYKQCVNGKIVTKKCPAGLHYNPYKQECTHPCDAGCDKDWPCHTPTPTPTPTPPPECTGNGKRPDEHDCSKYKQCVNGKIVTKKCPAGLHYNPYKQECTHPCEAGCDKDWPCHTPTPTPTPPPECTGNGKRPDEHDCSKYKQCVNGKIVTKKCPVGLHYNPYKQECTHPCEAGCDKDWPCHTPTPTPPPGCSGDHKKPHWCDCSLYRECVNGTIVTRDCPKGLHFNPFEQKCQHPCDAGCDKDWPCGPTPKPQECSGSGSAPDPDDCNAYTICVDGRIKSRRCGKGLHFNPFAHECQDPKVAGCDNSGCGNTPTPTPTPTPRPPECNGNGKSPDKCDCGSYLTCENKIIVKKKCPPGMHFNPFELECQEPCKARCDKHRVCPPPTSPPLPECYGDSKTGVSSNCKIYKECVNGKIKTKNCPEGTHFNPFAQKCQHPCDARCDLSWQCPTPTPEPEHECSGTWKAPHPHNCHAYLQCKNGIIKEFKCPGKLDFNPYAQECQKIDIAGCDDRDTCKPECVDGTKTPHECDCRLYYVCEKGHKVLRTCGRKHFNPILKTCEHADDAGCKLPHPAFVGECVENYKVPHESICTSFYECKSGVKIPKDCPIGKAFSTHAQACVDPADSRLDC